MAWKTISKIIKWICWVIGRPSASWIKWLENYYVNISIFKKNLRVYCFDGFNSFFSRKDQRIRLKFNGKVNEIVKKINSLGVLFSGSGSFERPGNISVIKHQKIILYGTIRKKNRLHNLPLDFQIDLFDKVITRNYSCFVIWLWRTRFKKIIDVFECLQFI